LDVSLVRERSSILGKDLSIPILKYLKERPYSIASEVARRFDVHIATASKYLSEMEKAKLVASRIRQTGRKPAKEYYLLGDRIVLEIDLSEPPEKDALSRLGEQYVREAKRRDIAYEWDAERSVIREIVLIEDGHGRRAAKKISMDEVEGRFLWHLPLPGQPAKKVSQITREAGIEDEKDLEKVERLLDQLEELGIIERKRKRETGKAER